MKVALFSSWQVRCGIADYTAQLVAGLRGLDDTRVDVVAYDRQVHPRRDYVEWGRALNSGDVAHIQHEYSFFGYLLPWRNQFGAFTGEVRKPLVITRHVSFDGPLVLPGRGPARAVRLLKWSLYNRWLGPYARYLNKDTFDRADRIIVLTGRLRNQLAARGIDPHKIRVIPAGAPIVAPAAGGAALRRQLGWETKRVIGQFGYIAPPKGHALAIEALASLPEEYVLLIAGGPRLAAHHGFQQELERNIAARGLGARVHITGFVPEADMAGHMHACDALVYPYTHADFSYSVATGLAYCHAPVVASDLAGHREIAATCPGMLLFRSGDSLALASAVRQAVESPDVREAASVGMREYVRACSWTQIARRTRDVYAELLA